MNALLSLFLSALVGLGGIGAVVSFQHNSDLLDSIKTEARVMAEGNAPVSPTPSTTPAPEVTPDVTPETTPTATTTLSPLPSPATFQNTLRIHAGDNEGEQEDQNQIRVQTETRARLGDD